MKPLAGADVSRCPLALFYGVAGTLHLVRPEWFMEIMPPSVPYPHAVVFVTGLCEIAGAVGLFVPRYRRMAALMLALYAVCVFPANIHHAMIGGTLFGWPLDWRYHGPRLALQPLLVWWAWRAGGARAA